ncbi:aldose epimerase family protein [Sphingobacterium faecale]|uniref:Aldose 1-epimerase n=1 Tax=Sphingobacterium faecale TaxID=2803775 RepID=A0ABS1R3I8_9SPHI|nr:aldose epimerase family protein [Sphingobacterium faecale]MBL1409279.1 galactose mutarotase [Sphingobacterium faecale]
MKNKSSFIGILVFINLLAACQHSRTKKDVYSISTEARMDSTSFAGKVNGKAVQLYELENKNGIQAYFTNFGARIVSLYVPDRDNNFRDIILGFSKATDYNNPKEPYFGAIVGPFANRIAKGTFVLDGNTYNLPINNGINTLHGGFKGVHFANWQVQTVNDSSITFAYTLPDRAEGFPGNISMQVTYLLNDQNELTISYKAQSDKTTVINLTNHAYFNLNGEGSGTILNHQLQLFADKFTPVDSTLIPTGEQKPVHGTAFDFTALKAIGRDINASDQQLHYGKGYDHNFVLKKQTEDKWYKAAHIVGDQSGIVMDIFTQEPGMQFYSGNFMNEQVRLKNGAKDSFRTGFCLEPQHFPDSPNQPNFPSTELPVEKIYQSKSLYRFSVKF